MYKQYERNIFIYRILSQKAMQDEMWKKQTTILSSKILNSTSYFTLAEEKDVKWDPQSELWHGI